MQSRLPGEHEFTAFTPAESQHEVFVRIVREAMWERRGDHLHFTVTADSFLRHMVRTLVGTMLHSSPERFARLLDGPSPAGGRGHRPSLGPLPRARGVRQTPDVDTIERCGTASSSSTSTAP